jgi:FemAB-related protein (PEP-CTERM system-associated)
MIAVANQTISVSPLDSSSPHDAAEWDSFVRESGGSFCHLSGWRRIMEEVLGHETQYLCARTESGSMTGLLPMVFVRSRLFGHYLLSMPFLNYGGPLGPADAQSALINEAMRLADQRRVDLLEMRSRNHAPAGMQSISRKVVTVLTLPESAEELWEKGFRSKLRSQIRKPMKEGLETRFGSDQLIPFYEVFARNMRDLGTPVLPRAWFEAIQNTFADHVIYAAVYYQHTPVAAGCGFLFNGEFEITWASSLREHAARAPNMLLYWSLMEECIRRGATAFNFGRSTPGASTHRFKQQWGGEDAILPWGVSGPNLAPPNPDSAKYVAARNIWSRLPVGLSKLVGPTLARRLPQL